MARARNLKPALFKDDRLAETGPEGMLLFAGLWGLADRAGRLEDRPRWIKAEVIPYFDADADALLDALAERGFILRYESDGRRYIWVRNFERHQNPHKNEPASTLPAPEKYGAGRVQEPGKDGSAPADSLFIDSLSLDSGLLTAEDDGAADAAAGSADPPSPPPPPAKHEPPVPRTDDEPPPVPRRPPPEPNASYRLFQVLCEETDADEAEASAGYKREQTGIAKGLLGDGYGEEDVRGCIRFLRSQTWRTGIIDLKTVRAEIGKWRTTGRPERESPKVTPMRPSGRDAAAAKRLADAFEVVEGRA